MSARKIDDQIRDYYQAQQPTPEAMARLQEAIRPQSRRSWRAPVKVAALLALALAPLLWLGGQRLASSRAGIETVVARQAADGHNQRPELEFRARDCAELRARMKSLDFSLVEPAMLHAMSMRLVGARYATIGGAIAAQLLFEDAHGVPCTLYQARRVGALAKVTPGDHSIDGLRVTVWEEKGLLMVLARPLA